MAVLSTLLLGLLVAGPAAAAEEPDATTEAHDHAEVVLENGRLGDEFLAPAGGLRLAREAAEAFNAMVEAARADGASLVITDGYRTYEAQVDLKERKGWLAATPGRSMHGWGLAVDFNTGASDMAWLRENAADFGWVHPGWAQPGGSKPEPWHWEYAGPVGQRGVVLAPEVTVRPTGSLLAVARFEFASSTGWGPWFAIREGVNELERGAGHYEGTAEPGEEGNFAVAGYQWTNGAPLRGLERLSEGDRIHVRETLGDEHTYRVVGSRELGDDDAWAIDPDPLGDGTASMLTLTTSPTPGTFVVVWAALED